MHKYTVELRKRDSGTWSWHLKIDGHYTDYKGVASNERQAIQLAKDARSEHVCSRKEVDLD